MAFFLAMLLFSMAGVPPLAGFFAKFYVFLAAIKAGLYALAVIGVLASVVGAYYYLLIVKVMYFDEPARRVRRHADELKAVMAVCGLFNLLFFALSRHRSSRRERGGQIAVLMRLDPAALAAGTSPAPHETLASTNAEALTRTPPASAGRSGSRRGSRPPAAAGAAMRGFRCPAISTRRCFSTSPRRRTMRPELSFVARLATSRRDPRLLSRR